MTAEGGENGAKKKKAEVFIDVWRRPTHDGRWPRLKNKYKKLYNQQTKTLDRRRRDIARERNDFLSYGHKDMT
jgi:hypothetical protein